MSQDATTTSLHLLAHPYDRLDPLRGGRLSLKAAACEPGTAILCSLGSGHPTSAFDLLVNRPGGLSLLVVLPPATRILENSGLAHTVQQLRPHAILPHVPRPQPQDLAHLLRRPPADLSSELTEYLAWRGIAMDQSTTRLVRRVIELAADLRSVSALARSMYMSRRALGRRFTTQGLPVPSHWLQMARLIRVTIRLQNTGDSVFAVACGMGYPDGFSVSNQMSRLFGVRPSQVRERLGWEWVVEAWLRREAESGSFGPATSRSIRDSRDQLACPPISMLTSKRMRQGVQVTD